MMNASTIHSSKSHRLLGVLLSFFMMFCIVDVGAQCHPDDYAALKALYEATDGDNWTNNWGWDVSGEDPPANCNLNNWLGVEGIDSEGRITWLSISFNNLTGAIPPEIEKLTHLRELILAYNNLTAVASELGNLLNLERLNLNGNKLTEISFEEENESGLMEIFLGSNNLTQFSPSLTYLDNLLRLELNSNNINVIDSEIGDLTNLESLGLSSNNISYLTPEIGNLINLNNLSLEGNNLSLLPPEIGNLISLRQLTIDDNNLTQLPPQIGDLNSLEFLSLSYNSLNSNFPSSIKNLINLRDLDLNGNNMAMVPPELGELVNLESLSLNSNEISALPVEIGNLINLKGLDISGNRINTMPPEFGELVSLEELILIENEFTGLPTEIGNLINLKYLALSSNPITSLPGQIGDLSSLEDLDISNTFITCFPSGMSQLCTNPNFKVYSEGNPNLDSWEEFCTTGDNECTDQINCSDGIQNGDEQGIDCGGTFCLPCECEHPDLHALVEFYHSTDGPNWINNQGWSEGFDGTNCDPCSWPGVFCEDNRVIGLFINDNNLSGYLPPQIAELTNLRSLNLAFNNIDSLPEEIGQLVNLRGLVLSNNNLEFIPFGISSLDQLQFLELSSNFISAIPPVIGNLSSLNALGIAFNPISDLPDELGSLSTLNVLYISNTFVTCFPPGMYDLCSNQLLVTAEGNPQLGSWEDFCNNEITPCGCGDTTPPVVEDINCVQVRGLEPETCEIEVTLNFNRNYSRVVTDEESAITMMKVEPILAPDGSDGSNGVIISPKGWVDTDTDINIIYRAGLTFVDIYFMNECGLVSSVKDICPIGLRVDSRDSEPPIAQCQDVFLYLDDNGEAVLTPEMTDLGSSDNCSEDLLLNIAPEGNNRYFDKVLFDCSDAEMTYPYEFIVRDRSSSTNETRCVFNVSVMDTVPPVLKCQDLSVMLDDSGLASITSSDIDLNSYDNCSSTLSYTLSQTSFDCSQIGVQSVIMVVNDDYGNSSICEVNVTVLANENCDYDQDGWTLGEGDCDDLNLAINPGAKEICDGLDNNCDGSIDEKGLKKFYADLDGDGFGDPNAEIAGCEEGPGVVKNKKDCDDTDASIYPGAPEICGDGIDQDCNGKDKKCRRNGKSAPNPFEQFEEYTITAFPNPFTERIQLSIDSPAETAATVTILDITGRQVMLKSITLSAGSQLLSFDASSIDPGVYVLHVHTAEARLTTEKLVKH